MNFGAYIELGSLLHHDLSVELFAPTKDRKGMSHRIFGTLKIKIKSMGMCYLHALEVSSPKQFFQEYTRNYAPGYLFS
jgi:hypothetical protein